MGNKELYIKHGEHMLNFARSILNHYEDAEDICMTVWCSYLQKDYPEGKALYILMAMVKNACLNKLSKKEVKIVEFADMEVEDVLVEAVVLDKLFEEVQLLPPGCRRVIDMFYKEQKTYEEIQQTLNITRWTMHNHLKKGRRILKNNPRLKLMLNIK